MPQKAVGGILVCVALISVMAWFFVFTCRLTKNMFVRGIVGIGFLLIIGVGIWSFQMVVSQEGVSGLNSFLSNLFETVAEWAKGNR